MTIQKSVLLLGAGSMGGSLLSCWLDQGLIDVTRSAVVDPNPSDLIASKIKETSLALNPEVDLEYDICVLAVKPQMLPAIIPSLDWPNIKDTLFLSVLAGKSIGAIRTHLIQIQAGEAPIIRTMPNLPVSIGKGVTLLYGDDDVSVSHREAAFELMAAAGSAYWVEGEAQIDSGMSVASCGPAYVFLLAEAMQEAGEAAGLPTELAASLAQETVSGAAALMALDERSPVELRSAVTSKGGTTAEAIKILDGDNAFRPLLREAVAAATRRANELSE